MPSTCTMPGVCAHTLGTDRRLALHAPRSCEAAHLPPSHPPENEKRHVGARAASGRPPGALASGKRQAASDGFPGHPGLEEGLPPPGSPRVRVKHPGADADGIRSTFFWWILAPHGVVRLGRVAPCHAGWSLAARRPRAPVSLGPTSLGPTRVAAVAAWEPPLCSGVAPAVIDARAVVR